MVKSGMYFGAKSLLSTTFQISNPKNIVYAVFELFLCRLKSVTFCQEPALYLSSYEQFSFSVLLLLLLGSLFFYQKGFSLNRPGKTVKCTRIQNLAL